MKRDHPTPARVILAAGFCLALALGVAHAQQTIVELLEQQASIEVATDASAGSLIRLPLSPEVLATVRSDLSDIRVLTAAGAEVPYLVDAGAARRVQVSERHRAEVISADRDLTTQEGELPVATEIYELALPPRVTSDLRGQRTWDLVFDISESTWITTVDLGLVGPGADQVDLLEGASLFKLDSPAALRSRLPVGQIDAQDTEQRLRVVMRSRRADYLEPQFRFERVSGSTIDAGSLRVALDIAELDSERGKTRVTIPRAPGLSPRALEIATSTATFGRTVTVLDQGALGGGRVLGRGRILRLGGPGVPIETTTVELSGRAQGNELELAIEDGNSPALADLEVYAIFRQPSLIFPAPGTSTLLLFGGDRVGAPNYDLDSLRGSLGLEWGSHSLQGTEIALAEALVNAQLPVATIGDIVDNPSYDQRPALSFAMRAGAELDPRSFTHRRILQIPETRDGLVRLTLEPADTTLAQPALGDFRVVDGESRQWPFLVHRPTRAERRPLAVRHDTEANVSRFVLALGSEEDLQFTTAQVELDIEEPFFDRSYEMACNSDRNGDSSTSQRLGSGQLRRGSRDRRAPLLVGIDARRCAELVLDVDDGDDAPLTLRGAWVYLELPELLIAAPAGSYQLLLGDPEMASPSYEIRRARDLVLAVSSVPVAAGPLEANPSYTRRSRLSRPRELERVGVYAIVGAAALVLGFITWRTLRGVEPPPGS